MAANSGKWSRERHYSKERGERDREEPSGGLTVPLIPLLLTAGSCTFPNSSLSLFAGLPGKKRNCLWQRQRQ